MTHSISSAEWEHIEEDLFAKRILSAINRVSDLLECDMREACDVVAVRFAILKHQRPERFQCDLESYWDGFNPTFGD